MNEKTGATTTPAGLVSRESVREMIERECAYYVRHSGVARGIRTTALDELAKLPSAELPAIGVSDATPVSYRRKFPHQEQWSKWTDLGGESPDDIRSEGWDVEVAYALPALEAALRPSGEDRG